MKSRTMVAATLLMLCLVGLPQAEAGVIDISGGDDSAGSWGGTAHISYGQTFTVPAGDSVLVDYSFSLVGGTAHPFLFVSQVYAWNGSGVTGPSLFTSEALLTRPLDIYSTYVFAPSIPVTAGQQYIALVTNQPDGVPFEAPPDSGGGMFLKEGNPYAGGEFVFTGDNPATGRWALTLSDEDAVFHADLVPEPATLVLFGFGFAGLTVWGTPWSAFRRRKSQ
jgi:hypothetical protein